MSILNLNNQALASYHNNAFCINAGQCISIMDANRDQLEVDMESLSLKEFSIFTHEYWHYLLNISTLTGLKDFKLFQTLVEPFWKGIAKKPLGIFNKNNLDKEDENYVVSLITLYKSIYGYRIPNHPNVSNRTVKDFKITGYKINDDYKEIDGDNAPFSEVILKLSIETLFGEVDKEFPLGTLVINEGLAYEVENMICKENEKSIPCFPYKVIRKISEYILDDSITNLELCKIATLSMLTVNAPAAFIDFLELIKNKLNEEKSIDKIIDFIWNNYKSRFKNHIKVAIKDMEDMVNIYKDRGLLEYAMNYLSAQYKRLLNKRLENPFFDLHPFSNENIDIQQIVELFKEIAPCDAIIENPDKNNEEISKDILISFTGNKLWNDTIYTPTDFLRALQCQSHYLQSHIDLNKNKFVSSKSSHTKACPFYTICELENRKNSSDICKNKPWEVFKENEPKSCWYGVAVASTLGSVNVENKQIPGNIV